MWFIIFTSTIKCLWSCEWEDKQVIFDWPPGGGGGPLDCPCCCHPPPTPPAPFILLDSPAADCISCENRQIDFRAEHQLPTWIHKKTQWHSKKYSIKMTMTYSTHVGLSNQYITVYLTDLSVPPYMMKYRNAKDFWNGNGITYFNILCIKYPTQNISWSRFKISLSEILNSQISIK